jgi:hypothetical protein
MDNRLDWYTTRIGDGSQVVHIRPTLSSNPNDVIYLDQEQTRLFMALLDQIAADHRIAWSEARQAILQGFLKALRPRA